MSAYSQDNPAVRRQFEKIDWDKDGVISKEDLKAFLAQVGATPSAQYRKALFKEADLDHKGLITYADFVELVTRIRQGETLEWGPLLDHATRSLKKNTLLRQLARGAGEFFGVSDSFTLTSSGRWGTMGYFDRTADRPDLSKEPHGAEEEEEEESAAPRGGTLARAQDFLRRIPGIFQQHQGDQQDQQQRHEARDLGREEKLHGMASPETASPDEPPVDESKVKDKEAKRRKKNKHRAAQSQEPSGLQEITVRTESEPLELGDDGGALAPESIATLPLQDGAESEADLSRARPAPEPLAGSEGQEPGPSEQPSEQPSSAPAKHKKPKKSSKHGKRAASHEMHEINPSDLLAASDHSIDLSNPPSMQLSELIALQEPSAPGRSTSALSLNAVPVTQLEDLEQPTTVVFSSECSTSSRKLSRTWKSIRGKRPAELPEVSIEPPSPVRPTAQSVFHPDPSPSVAFSSAQALPARTPEGLETLVEISEGNTLVPTVERRGRRRSGTAGSRGSARLQAFTRSFTTLLRDPKVRKFMLREKSWPIFTVLVIIAQLTLLSLGLYYQRGIDDFYNNPFIGPSQSILRSLGARYTPCMRDLTPSTRAKFEVQSLDDPIACPLDYSGPSNGTECTFFDAVEHICGMGGFHSSVPDQGFRLLTANFLHAGVIHLLIVLLFEIRVGMHVEREIGSIRTFLIFTISGVAGHLLAAIMSPNSTTTGASGAVFGLVSLLFIDILQNWPLLKRPKFNLGILSFVTLLTFLAGLLPAIDNYAHIGGFVAGTLCGFIFVPSVNLGKRDAKRKRILLAISVPALLLYLGLLFGLFYGGADGGNCKSCQAIECLPLNSPWCGI